MSRFVAWLFIVTGAASLVAGTTMAVSAFLFLRTARRTDARVIELVAQVMQRPSTPRERPVKIVMQTNYAPVFVFRDESGATHTVRSEFAGARSTWRVGQTVPVLYSPRYPENAKLDTFLAIWGMPASIGFVGVIFTSIGLVVRRRRVRERAEAALMGS
jgi:hypothetical protein